MTPELQAYLNSVDPSEWRQVLNSNYYVTANGYCVLGTAHRIARRISTSKHNRSGERYSVQRAVLEAFGPPRPSQQHRAVRIDASKPPTLDNLHWHCAEGRKRRVRKPKSTTTCAICRSTKPLDQFATHYHNDKGNHNICHDCYPAHKADETAKAQQARLERIEHRRANRDTINPTHTCNICHQTKPRADFNARARNANGLQSMCRDCQHQHYQETREHHIELVRNRKYRDRQPRFSLLTPVEKDTARAFYHAGATVNSIAKLLGRSDYAIAAAVKHNPV